MGIFKVDCVLVNPESPRKTVRVEDLLVDSDSEHTWIPGEALRRAGIRVRKKDVSFLMANGQTIARDVGYAILRTGEFETVDEVVFGHAGDLKLLGSRTLEGFPAVVDPRRKRLVAAGPVPAA